MSDNVPAARIVDVMVEAGHAKTRLGIGDLLIRGGLAGALLGFATSLALLGGIQSNNPFVGALIFPVGFAMIVLLALDLVTGSFAVMPMAMFAGRASGGEAMRNIVWVFIGNLIGGLLYAVLLWIVLTDAGALPVTGLADRIRAVAEAKTNAYAAVGAAGLLAVFVKAILCNWMVCLGVVMGMSSTSTAGKIVACWLPIVTFFALGYEHSVVNMFVIPAGMLFGAKVTVGSWWLWNQIPVTIGNLVGGLSFVAAPLWLSYGRRGLARPAAVPSAETA